VSLLFGIFDSNFNRSRDRDNPQHNGGIMADIAEIPRVPNVVQQLSGFPIIYSLVRMVGIGRISWGGRLGIDCLSQKIPRVNFDPHIYWVHYSHESV